MSVFGFSTEPSSGGDFTPILKYDARAGRFFRVDRTQNPDGSFLSEPVDITQIFKAIADFDNIEVGWLNFVPGQAPDVKLVAMGKQLPERPSQHHKNGVRFMVKLSKECAHSFPPIREVMGQSKAMLAGIEAVYTDYEKERGKHAGQLPVLVLDKTVPITTGSGAKTSTNYKPVFRIVAWVPRGDLVAQPRGNGVQPQATSGNQQQATPPATGAQRAAAPAAVTADDFG